MTTNFKLRSLFFLGLGLILTIATGCDKDEVSPSISINDFVGSWTATSMVMTNNEDSKETIDFVEIGGEVRITVLTGGKVRTWTKLDTFSDEWDAQSTVEGSTITSVAEEAARGTSVYTYTLDGNTLELTNTSDGFDFTFTGQPEVSSTSVGQFIRQ